MGFVWIQLTKDLTKERDHTWKKDTKVQVTTELFQKLKNENKCKLILEPRDAKPTDEEE